MDYLIFHYLLNHAKYVGDKFIGSYSSEVHRAKNNIDVLLVSVLIPLLKGTIKTSSKVVQGSLLLGTSIRETVGDRKY